MVPDPSRLTEREPSRCQGPKSGGLPERALDSGGHPSPTIDVGPVERSEIGAYVRPSNDRRAARNRHRDETPTTGSLTS